MKKRSVFVFAGGALEDVDKSVFADWFGLSLALPFPLRCHALLADGLCAFGRGAWERGLVAQGVLRDFGLWS